MQRTILCLVVLAAIPALGQSVDGTVRANPQTLPFSAADLEQMLPVAGAGAGCEVHVLKAAFERPARMMRVAKNGGAGVPREGAQDAPALSFQIENRSAKKTAAIDLLARIKFKDSVYQLDSATREIPIHVTSGSDSQRLRLSESAMGFDSLAVELVTYADGSTWKPEHRLACGYRGGGSQRVAK